MNRFQFVFLGGNNGNGFSSPQNVSPVYIQYDGYTIPIVAYKTGLAVGSTFHLIIGIADVHDGVYDSGIFIERWSTYHCTLTLDDEIPATRRLIAVFDILIRKQRKCQTRFCSLDIVMGLPKKYSWSSEVTKPKYLQTKIPNSSSFTPCSPFS